MTDDPTTGLAANSSSDLLLIREAEREAAEWDATRVRTDLDPIAQLLTGYQVIRELHWGGQGVVYEAVQISTRRRVAVKVIIGGQLAGSQSKRRFEREVEIAADLKHPNIVTIFDSGLAQGCYYYAMDYIRGLPLDEYVRFKSADVREIMRLFTLICDAMSYAHHCGVIHRDLKPSNILVTDEGAPIIVDFGLAKVIDANLESSLLTDSGRMMGTLRYMAPEQATGKLEAIDTRTDVYALGVILYELLTDCPPYDTRTNLSVAVKNILTYDPLRPSRRRKGVNTDLDAIVLKSMEKDSRRRYGSAGELAQDVGAWLEGRPVQARSASSLYVIHKLAMSHSYETLTIACVLFSLLGFGILVLHSEHRKRLAAEDEARTVGALHLANLDLDQFKGNALSALRENAMGWFLVKWRDGQYLAAHSMLKGTRADSPEHAVMLFLLDEKRSPDELMSSLPKKSKALGYLAIGEKQLKAGRIGDAKDAFERTVESADERQANIRDVARGRLAQIEGFRALSGSNQ